MIGEWLQAMRMERQYTQRELSEAIGLKYYTYLAQIESGTSRVPLQRIPAYALVFGMSVSELIAKMEALLQQNGITDPVYSDVEKTLVMPMSVQHGL